MLHRTDGESADVNAGGANASNDHGPIVDGPGNVRGSPDGMSEPAAASNEEVIEQRAMPTVEAIPGGKQRRKRGNEDSEKAAATQAKRSTGGRKKKGQSNAEEAGCDGAVAKCYVEPEDLVHRAGGSGRAEEPDDAADYV